VWRRVRFFSAFPADFHRGGHLFECRAVAAQIESGLPLKADELDKRGLGESSLFSTSERGSQLGVDLFKRSLPL